MSKKLVNDIIPAAPSDAQVFEKRAPERVHQVREMLHELKQPLLTMLVLAERLECRVNRHMTEGSPMDLQIHRKDIQGLLSAIDQLRNLMVTRGALVNGVATEYGWAGKIERVLENIDVLAQSRGVVLRWEGLSLDQEMGPEPRMVVQILSNMILNAMDAMDESGSTNREVLVQFKISAETIRLEIHDSGPGISDKVRTRIFKKGFTTKRKSGGTGLGLWMCQQLLSGMRGSVTVSRSESLGGACFVIEIPVPKVAPIALTA